MIEGHRLVDDELRQLIRNQDKSEPTENDFGFGGQENPPDLALSGSKPTLRSI